MLVWSTYFTQNYRQRHGHTYGEQEVALAPWKVTAAPLALYTCVYYMYSFKLFDEKKSYNTNIFINLLSPHPQTIYMGSHKQSY